MAASFPVPAVTDNPDGWGPCTVPAHLKDIPFAPFNKGDKLGRVADWTQGAFGPKYAGEEGLAAIVCRSRRPYKACTAEESFHLVDNRPVKTTKFGAGRRYQQNQRFQQQRRDGKDGRGGPEVDKKKGGPQQQKKQHFYGRDNQRPTQYSSSVEIGADWQVMEQISTTSLSRLNYSPGEPEDLLACGSLEYYDKSYDNLAVKKEKPLEKTKRIFRTVTTSDDPIMQQLASSGKARVFAVDSILTHLMCMQSSKYGWDLLATRKGDKLFFDWRASSKFTLLTVNETAPEAVPEDKDNINGMHHLALEATAINQNFSQQVLIKDGGRLDFGQPNPFASPSDAGMLASCAYKYRKWRLASGNDAPEIVVRCEVDAALRAAEGAAPQTVLIKALNEYDLKSQVCDYRKRLENQKGAVLLSETKNNKFKVAKWTASALLSGADQIKLGFISRATPRDVSNHVVLAMHALKPRDAARSISLDMDNCWGIVRALCDMLLALDEGTYLLVKDPNKELLRVYSVPPDAFAAVAAPVEDDDLDGVDMGGESAGVHVDVTVPIMSTIAAAAAADAED
ncbi:eukaryotic translation initiation factor 3d [Volvox carteri f. nagariensis]|uniref:Eukaryotic translation initiation factor 3d n=1 Tax=Volvox carteri f. nagariensis TaxID=3068 RepID=D8UJK9_VOLCA|nr:eukaryotic translation initiation factor 3d [Volvox carteri f. nagariensis]EFJ40085.1 eukaryotic translation initiation factor 3d [Volvox carteri f. nagariensis]|eukprot:XP_002958834.1 eukaryotic translation initiation factor 3d [Volvox carteri f. nagariensis]